MLVDAGLATPLPDSPDLRVIGAGRGTADIALGPAMTRERRCAWRQSHCAGGRRRRSRCDWRRMGGNTTASSAIAAVLTGRLPGETTGRGGRSDWETQDTPSSGH